jgi:biotin carboxylase
LARVLLLATTTGYQTRSFGDAAERLGVDLVFATDRCDKIEDPWRDRAIPIRFYEEDRSVAAIVDSARTRPLDGVIAVGDRPTVIAARVGTELGLPGHPPEAAAIARNKLLFRERLRGAGLLIPPFVPFTIRDQPPAIDHRRSAASHQPLTFPVVIKPVALSGSRGVIRADDPKTFADAFERLRALLRSPEIRAERNDAHDTILVEEFIPGQEYAIEGLLHHGALHVFAIFDKPDPLDGPFFEETIYVTPSIAPPGVQHAIVRAVSDAACAIGLHHGAIHAECRVNERGVFVLEVAARPIGGLCARVLRFRETTSKSRVTLEEVLLRHALGGEPPWTRETAASGVMMIPIPRRGIYRGVDGIDLARAVNGVDDVRITAKADQVLVPLPEGASYLGFIFARAATPAAVERALRDAHARLTFAIDPELRVLTAAQTRYNHRHG